MWKCPKCPQEFAQENEAHECASEQSPIDLYILEQADEVQPILFSVRDAIRSVLPDDVEELIKWRMPTFYKGYNIIHFAGFKNHLGIYPGDKGVEHFALRLGDYKFSKGAIQFQYAEPIPYELIKEIAAWCYETGNYHGGSRRG